MTFPKKEPALSREAFVDAMEESISNGSRPVMQSFNLVSITPVKGGYEVRACSNAQRESFHFKGIVKFTAYLSGGHVLFGSWMSALAPWPDTTS
jgi:hypothetical protein